MKYEEFVVRIGGPPRVLDEDEAKRERERLLTALRNDDLRRLIAARHHAPWKSHPVQVLSSPFGQAGGSFVPPFDREALKVILPDLARRAGALPPADEAAEGHRDAARSAAPPAVPPDVIGGALFASLFKESVGNLFHQSCGVVRRQPPPLGLCVQLRFDPTDPDVAAINSLPWELLCNPQNGQYLCGSRFTPVIRYLEVAQPAPPMPPPGRLRILVVVANPCGLPPLDLAKERANFEEVRGQGGAIDVDFLPQPATPGALRRVLRDAEERGQPYHVLHFMGHGDFDVQAGEGLLHLEAKSGRSLPVSGNELALNLTDLPNLRLVVLNACNTARIAAEAGVSPFAGVAPALVRAGIPAVVAMQLPISDRAAIDFSDDLYSRLARAEPLPAAVTEGRFAIGFSTIEWATPVLFLRQTAPERDDPELPPAFVFLTAPILGLIDAWVVQPLRDVQVASSEITVARPDGQLEVFAYYLAAASLAAIAGFAVERSVRWRRAGDRPPREGFSMAGLRRSLASLPSALARPFWITATAVLLAAVLLGLTLLVPSVGAIQEVGGRAPDPDHHHYLFVRALGEGTCWLQTPIPLLPDQDGRWRGEAHFGGRGSQRFELIAVAAAEPLHPEIFSRPGGYPCTAIPRGTERFARLVELDR